MLSLTDPEPGAPCPEPFNLADYVLSAGRATPDKVALEICTPHAVTRYTYAQIGGMVRQTAGALLAHDIRAGDRLMMRLGNDLSFPITYLAALWIGAVPIPTSAQLTEGEIDRLVALAAPKCIIAGDGISVSRSVPVLPWHTLQDTSVRATPDPDLGDPERLGYIIFTSGTTQGPRGVCHAHRAIWARRMMFDGWYGLTPEDRLMHAGAFNWTYTLGTGLMDPWTLGATAVIAQAGTPADQFLKMIAERKVTIFAAAPGVYRQMLREKEPVTLPALRHGLSAGEKLAPSLKHRWSEVSGRDVHEALGMSECSTFISGSPTRPAQEVDAGWPQPGRRVAVLDETGAPVPRHTPGALAIHRTDPGLCLRYLDADHGDGDWFDTGDMVSMSPDGAIRYLGRTDDMLNAGGFRVSPLEVEAAFLAHDAVQDAAAVAVRISDEVTLIALVYAAAEPLPDPDLRAHAEALLARYKQPRLYFHRAALPKGGNGKLNRKALRAELEREHDQT